MDKVNQVEIFSHTKKFNPDVPFGQEYADFHKEIVDKLNEKGIQPDPNSIFSEMKSEGNVIEFAIYRRVFDKEDSQ